MQALLGEEYVVYSCAFVIVQPVSYTHLNNKFAVSSKVYDRFSRVFQKQEKVKMYLASGYCKYHSYDEGSMDVVEYHYNQHLGLLLIYCLLYTSRCV